MEICWSYIQAIIIHLLYNKFIILQMDKNFFII